MRLTKSDGGRRVTPSFSGVVEGEGQGSEREHLDQQVGTQGCGS